VAGREGRPGIGADDRTHLLTSFHPAPNQTRGLMMYSDKLKGESSPKELEGRIKGHLLVAFRAASSLHQDGLLYLFQYGENDSRGPFDGNDLDEIYDIFENSVNDCRRLWMKLRASSKKQAPILEAAGSSLASSGSRFGMEGPPSSSEQHLALDEGQPPEPRKEDDASSSSTHPLNWESVLNGHPIFNPSSGSGGDKNSWRADSSGGVEPGVRGPPTPEVRLANHCVRIFPFHTAQCISS